MDSRLKIALDRPADTGAVVQFFEGTDYLPETIDERTIALAPPEEVPVQLARREVEIYLRVLARVYDGVSASLVA